ncbi:hypothetical protein OKW38_007557 [Paraburkholderia sp. MM5496-R1]
MRQLREPLTPFPVISMAVVDADDSGLYVAEDCLGNIVGTSQRCKKRPSCASKVVGGPMRDGQARGVSGILCKRVEV